jgi:hypothetical protein
MRRKKIRVFLTLFFLVLVAVFLSPQDVFAPPGRMAAYPSTGFLPTILDVLLLVVVLLCLFSSLKVKSFLKEGELSFGFLLFSFSFAILFMAQLLSLSVSSGLLNISLTIVSLIRLLSIISLASGIYSIKKVLS